MSQLQGDSAPTTLAGAGAGAMVHLALWSPLLCRTRCGIEFQDDAARVDEPVNCMTCLTRADTFEIPLQASKPSVNHFDETCWMVQKFGPPYGHITECCYAEDPCDYHKPKHL